MTLLNNVGLSKALGVSAGRISQYVSGGKLDGCYSGDGRLRRFDLAKVAVALGRTLHPGQMLGNGAETKRALAALPIEDEEDDPPVASAPQKTRDGAELPTTDPTRYEMARIQKAEEETRRLRRQNGEAEGKYVLASEVERQVARLMAQEIAEFEAVLRDGARRVADMLGQDFKIIRKIMVDEWRTHRAGRADQLVAQVSEMALTEAETEANI